jgi:hypothetical protein
MKTTIFVLLLPILLFFGFVHATHYSDSVALPVFIVWMLCTVICFARGFFIFRRQRRLAWSCFAVAVLQVILAILPALADINVRHSR